MFMFFYYDFFKKLTGFVQNRAVDSALKKYPGLYLFSKKKKKQQQKLKMRTST